MAAVDVDALAREPAGLGAEQEPDRHADVVGRAERGGSASGRGSPRPWPRRPWSVDEVGLDEARTHRVHPHARGAQFVGEVLDERVDGGLADRVGRHEPVGLGAGDRRDGRHRPATGSGDGRAGVLEGEERAGEVDREDPIPLLPRRRDQRTEPAGPGVGDREVEPPERLGGGGDGGCHLVLVDDVAGGGVHRRPVGRGLPELGGARLEPCPSRPQMVTVAPSRTRWRAHDNPMPLPPPVISAA
ncbi:MAG: hypothetical protein U5R31_06915 [Acidimicrobiia bacterium]|nr:hypothetical protein [Acidimicrobiia bacterium]